MSAPFNISCEWLHSEDGNAAERATFAELSIEVSEYWATEVEDVLAKSVRPHARLSALRLAEWFAYNWWRLLWEPEANTYSWRASHKVGNAGGGYVWPDLSFSCDWQSVTLSSNPTPRSDLEPVRYLNRFEIPISIKDFEKGVSGFIEGTIARLSSLSVSRSDLNLLWDEILTERRDPNASQWRSLEACMGYDPDEAPKGLIDSLLKQMGSYGASAIQETASASKSKTISHINGLYDAANGNDGISVHIPDYDNMRWRLQAETDPSDIPWRRAERAAQVAREIWRLDVPISTGQLSDLFRITEKQFSDWRETKQKSLIAGFRDCDSPSAFKISWNSNYPTSRSFALVRLVADHITAPDNESLLPGTRSITSRQKFQRAFAQEFLCPFESLQQQLGYETPSSDDVHSVAEYFNVLPPDGPNDLGQQRRSGAENSHGLGCLKSYQSIADGYPSAYSTSIR